MCGMALAWLCDMLRSLLRSAWPLGALIACTACGSDDGTAPTTLDFSQHRLYQHVTEPFESYEDCLAAQDPESFLNCYQEVNFCPDGSAIIIVTDIQERGVYVLGDGYIDASWPEPFDAPPELRFDILSARHLVDSIKGWDWFLAEDLSSSYCPVP